MNQPILFIFSGLPAVGKTTLAKRLARYNKASYVRIDTIEQGIRELCDFRVQGEGYRLAYRIIEDNLRLGISSIADSCNPWELTRDEWRNVARVSDAVYIDIEVVCSDRGEHEERVHSRSSDIEGLTLPTWEQIQSREYHDWNSERIVIDTAGISEDEAFESLLSMLMSSNLVD